VTPWQTKGVLFQTEKKNKIGGEIQWLGPPLVLDKKGRKAGRARKPKNHSSENQIGTYFQESHPLNPI